VIAVVPVVVLTVVLPAEVTLVTVVLLVVQVPFTHVVVLVPVFATVSVAPAGVLLVAVVRVGVDSAIVVQETQTATPFTVPGHLP
jgi:hypothetical protein